MSILDLYYSVYEDYLASNSTAVHSKVGLMGSLILSGITINIAFIILASQSSLLISTLMVLIFSWCLFKITRHNKLVIQRFMEIYPNTSVIFFKKNMYSWRSARSLMFFEKLKTQKIDKKINTLIAITESEINKKGYSFVPPSMKYIFWPVLAMIIFSIFQYVQNILKVGHWIALFIVLVISIWLIVYIFIINPMRKHQEFKQFLSDYQLFGSELVSKVNQISYNCKSQMVYDKWINMQNSLLKIFR